MVASAVQVGTLRQRTRSAGVTLIELMIVVVIAGVLAAVALPAYSTFATKQRVKQAAVALHLALVTTRSEALRRNANVTLARTGSNWQDGWTIADAGGTVIQQQNGFGTTTQIAASIASVTYLTSGRTSNTSAQTFTITNTGTHCTYSVRVDTGGRPYVSKTGC